MTTHSLSAALLTHPDVPLKIEGWTGDEIQIVRPEYLEDGDEDCRMLVAPVDPESLAWMRSHPMVWRNYSKELKPHQP